MIAVEVRGEGRSAASEIASVHVVPVPEAGGGVVDVEGARSVDDGDVGLPVAVVVGLYRHCVEPEEEVAVGRKRRVPSVEPVARVVDHPVAERVAHRPIELVVTVVVAGHREPSGAAGRRDRRVDRAEAVRRVVDAPSLRRDEREVRFPVTVVVRRRGRARDPDEVGVGVIEAVEAVLREVDEPVAVARANADVRLAIAVEVGGRGRVRGARHDRARGFFRRLRLRSAAAGGEGENGERRGGEEERSERSHLRRFSLVERRENANRLNA